MQTELKRLAKYGEQCDDRYNKQKYARDEFFFLKKPKMYSAMRFHKLAGTHCRYKAIDLQLIRESLFGISYIHTNLH